MNRETVWAAMGDSPVSIPELAARADIPVLSARAYLVQWTKCGAVIRDDDGRYRRLADELPQLSRKSAAQTGIDADDLEWMRHYRLPREERARLNTLAEPSQ